MQPCVSEQPVAAFHQVTADRPRHGLELFSNSATELKPKWRAYWSSVSLVSMYWRAGMSRLRTTTPAPTANSVSWTLGAPLAEYSRSAKLTALCSSVEGIDRYATPDESVWSSSPRRFLEARASCSSQRETHSSCGGVAVDELPPTGAAGKRTARPAVKTAWQNVEGGDRVLVLAGLAADRARCERSPSGRPVM